MKQLKHKQNKTASSKTICSSVGRLVSLVILILMVVFSVIIFTNFTFNKADGNLATKEEQVMVELKYNTNLPNELDLSKEYLALELLNLIRGKTFKNRSSLYYIDNNNEKIFIALKFFKEKDK